jgi:hypothetical protein
VKPLAAPKKLLKQHLLIIAVIAGGIGAYILVKSFAAYSGPGIPISKKMVGLNGTYSVDAYVEDAKNLNVKWIRVEQWGDSASYASVPSALSRLSAHNIRVLPLVNDYQVGWVSATDKTTWINQLVYTAKTYGAGGTYWQDKTDLGSPVIEVGNEVYGQWYSWPDKSYLFPGEYAKMLKQAAQAVNTATSGRVKLIASVTGDYLDTNDLSGGANGTWKHWSTEMKKTVPDIESYLAGVAAHPYGDIPSLGIGTSTDPNWSHQVLYAIHDLWNIPIYVTEVGQKGPKVGLDKQAAAVNYYFDELANNSWIAGMFYYNQKDYQAYDPNGDNGWALIDYQDTRTPAWSAYKAKAAAFVSSNAKTGDLNNDGQVSIFDLSILLSNFGKTTFQASSPACDLNNDGQVSIFDLSILLSNFGK